MSLPIPLSVRLVSRADRHVTADVRDLSFRSVAPGGFASASLSLNRPLSTQADEIDYYGKLYVYDARNGSTVWEGRVEDLGRTASDDGQVWAVNAVGPAAHTRDRTVPLIYVDTTLTPWQQTMISAKPSAEAMIGDDPGNTGTGQQVLVCRFPQGTTLAVNDGAGMRYWPLQRAGQKLARYDYTWDAGLTNANWILQAVTRTDGLGGGSSEVSRTDNSNVAGGGLSAKVVVTDFPNGRNTLDLRLLTTAAGTTANDTGWASFANVVVVAMRYLADGTEKTTGYTASTVLASEVVADLLGRLLPDFDGANASIATTSYGIDQLAYPDGVTAAQVLDDLMALEAAYYWAAWESNSAGNYRFEWKAWPTTVRYEATVNEGIDSPGSAADLWNAVRVRYRDSAGAVQTVRRTSTVSTLTAAGLTRETIIDLGDEVGTAAAAAQAGDQFLAQHQYPPNAGTLTLSGLTLDITANRMVAPWEIRPGELIRVRGILPRVDALNATARDGVTVFRIVAATFNARDATVSLELDSYPVAVSSALAKLSVVAPPNYRRRRR